MHANESDHVAEKRKISFDILYIYILLHSLLHLSGELDWSRNDAKLRLGTNMPFLFWTFESIGLSSMALFALFWKSNINFS